MPGGCSGSAGSGVAAARRRSSGSRNAILIIEHDMAVVFRFQLAVEEAKLWELRAAVSFARLRRDQGRRAEAHELLASVYGWFTRGSIPPTVQDYGAKISPFF
jgi:hypothetical protein